MVSKKDKINHLFRNCLDEYRSVKNGKDILLECLRIAKMLLSKNRKYGNSAFKSIQIFSSQDAKEKVRGRIDSKIKRIQQSEEDDQEDTINDLIGYLIILKILE